MKTFIAIIVLALAVWGGYELLHKGSQANNNATSSNTAATSDTSNSANSTGNSSSQQTATMPILASSSTATLGNFLTASNGMTLYKYTKDTPGVSNCTGTCATIWPPYTVTSAAGLLASAGLTGNVSTITRADGTMQVTYNNTPLYFYSKDTKAGDTTGQNFGGVWFVVAP